ncbi:uncharacterized protein LOC111831063 [Capsella rubella]|uniref:uncharacterized protein LOC111831063 n=1 Tax=Capsella rubella TaxID=81985 RepID=UPI000CD4FE4B|nr:uncharacterized protein LOC111831063 [Capsella rubella]
MTCFLVYVHNLFFLGTSGQAIENFKKEMASKFEMSDLGKLTYYLGIEVCQNKDGITLGQNQDELKILEEAALTKCNLVHIPMERDIDATSYRKNVGCLRRSPSPSKVSKLIDYSDSSHNVDQYNGRSTAGTEAAKQAIRLQELLREITNLPCEKVIILLDNKSNEQKADILTKALGRIKFKEMRDLIGVRDMKEGDFKLKRENVGLSLNLTSNRSYPNPNRDMVKD